MSLFGPINLSSTSTFRLVTFDTALLGAALSASLALRNASTSIEARIARQAANASPAVIAPWELTQPTSSLLSRVADIKLLSSFINLKSDDVRMAGDDIDRIALFGLYQGITRLQTLAAYAAEEKTFDPTRERLNALFQDGLAEVSEFLLDTETDLVSLFLGEKRSSISSTAVLGTNTSNYEGAVIQTGNRSDALNGIVGNEVFTISIEKFGVTTDIQIDLSDISGTISINAVVDLMNAELDALVDGDGIALFATRFVVESDDDNDHFIKLNGSSLEDVAFSAAAAEPALYVAGNLSSNDSDVTIGTLTRLEEFASGDARVADQDVIAGSDVEAEEFAAKVEEANKEEVNPLLKDLGITIEKEEQPLYKETTTSAIAIDSKGSIYTLGQTAGDFGSQISGAETQDVFLTKTDADGNIIYSRLLGATSTASAFSMTIDANDNVIIAGETDSDIEGGDVFSGTDAFVTKYNSAGDEIFTHQIDKIATTSGLAVTTDANGDIYLAGQTSGTFNTSTSYTGGSTDAFVQKIDGSDGSVLAERIFGTTGTDSVQAIAIADDGDILVAMEQDGDGVLTKLDASDLTNEVFSVNLGSLGGGSIDAIAVEGTAIYLAGNTTDAGFTGGGSVTNSHNGNRDGFVVKIDDAGGSASADFTTFVGSTATDTINDIIVTGGTVYVAGQAGSTIEGESKTGFKDAFVAEIDGTTGAINVVETYGELLGEAEATGIAFANTGRSVLTQLGLPSSSVYNQETRDVTTQTSLRDGDHFFISINGAPARKVEIEAGDDFEDIARKINRLSFIDIEAESFLGGLKIKPGDGSFFDLTAGAEGSDALAKLGMTPMRIMDIKLLFDIDDENEGADSANLGGSFSLGIQSGFDISDQKAAEYVFNQLDNALRTIERANRSLVFNPFTAFTLAQGSFGPLPPRIAAQIAGYETALLRLQAFSGSSGGFF